MLGGVLLAQGAVAVFGWSTYWLALSVLALSVSLGAWGIYKAFRPTIKKVALTTDKTPTKLRFVQISDVHIGSRSSRFLVHVVDQITRLAPDFVCITGDFIDERNVSLAQLSPLAQLSMPIYFCSGNHEHYEDFDDILGRLKELGVNVLRGDLVERHGVQILGFDDRSDPNFLALALAEQPLRSEAYSILLFHRPIGLAHAAAHGIDLQLSGHTHNGQIKPFNWLVRMQFKYLAGRYQHGNTVLYVNPGTGTWGPTLRFGTQSEITLFELSHEGS